MIKVLSRVQLAALLAGPVLVALFGGGFSENVRLTAGLTVWGLVVLGLFIRRSPLPQTAAGLIALTGLAAFVVLTALSLDWTPLRTAARQNIELGLLYLGAFMAAVPALRSKNRALSAELSVLITALSASLWGLSERVLPRLVDFGPPGVTGGRLSEPLGYWNGLGALCGLGLVMAARIAADRNRPRSLRCGAAATFPILSCALFMTYSRGGLAVTAAGLAALVALRPTRPQLLTAVAAPVGGLVAAIVANQSSEIKFLTGSIEQRASAGASLGIVLLASVSICAVASWLLLGKASQQPDAGRSNDTLLPRPVSILAGIATLVLLASPVAAALLGTPSNVATPSQGQAGVARLKTADSDRQLYWKIAWQQFDSHKIKGTGSGAFRLAWVQSRYAAARPAVNAHSLEIESAAELGLLGLLTIFLFLGGLVMAGYRAHRLDPRVAAGAAAGSLLMLGHSAFDWDWQLPGVILPAILLAASLVASGDGARPQSNSPFAGMRVIVLCISLIAGGWLAHEWRSAQLVREAGTKLDAARVIGFTPERYASINMLLDDAQWLSADSGPARAKAITAILAGHPREGIAQLKKILENDPYDYLSWVALSRASFRIGDKYDFAIAQRALQSFHPALTGDARP